MTHPLPAPLSQEELDELMDRSNFRYEPTLFMQRVFATIRDLQQRLSQAEARARTPGTYEVCDFYRKSSTGRYNAFSCKWPNRDVCHNPDCPPHPQGSDEDISLRCAEPRLRGGGMTVQELIARLEAADGPDRELDVAITEAIGLRKSSIDGTLFWFGPEDGYEVGFMTPSFTASIGDALWMVPEGHSIHMNLRTRQKYQPLLSNWACVAPYGLGGPQSAQKRRHLEAHHSVEAIALCIAALKARQAQADAPARSIKPTSPTENVE